MALQKLILRIKQLQCYLWVLNIPFLEKEHTLLPLLPARGNSARKEQALVTQDSCPTHKMPITMVSPIKSDKVVIIDGQNLPP